MTDEIVTRFAPSPTGRLHLGHAYSALFAAAAARDGGGRFLLRIEDIDASRAKPEFERTILEDLAWLGLEWETPVRRQSEHMADYERAAGCLKALGVVYPCFCTRAEIRAEVERSAGAPHGPDGPLYPGTCKRLDDGERNARVDAGETFALRLDSDRAARIAGPISWTDVEAGERPADAASHGDVVVARKDVPTSYHLAVTVDDALQGVTLVTRGLDLMPATHVHRLLRALLDLPEPRYRHHRLITDGAGRRLATRNDATALRTLRERGAAPGDIRKMVGLGAA